MEKWTKKKRPRIRTNELFYLFNFQLNTTQTTINDTNTHTHIHTHPYTFCSSNVNRTKPTWHKNCAKWNNLNMKIKLPIWTDVTNYFYVTENTACRKCWTNPIKISDFFPLVFCVHLKHGSSQMRPHIVSLKNAHRFAIESLIQT